MSIPVTTSKDTDKNSDADGCLPFICGVGLCLATVVLVIMVTSIILQIQVNQIAGIYADQHCVKTITYIHDDRSGVVTMPEAVKCER